MGIQKYNRLRQEIAKLEREAEKARRDAIRDALKQIKALMNEYGVTIADIGGRAGPGRPKAADSGAKPPAVGAKRGKVAPKYRSPTDQQLTWTGRGRTPRWVSDWTAAGNQLEALLII